MPRTGLAAQIADALAAIHGLSILHKDLKPANILIREQHGRPAIALTDFGSGRALNTALFEQLGITRMGADLTAETPGAGTQTYAAPEIAKLIVHAPDRPQAIARLRRALQNSPCSASRPRCRYISLLWRTRRFRRGITRSIGWSISWQRGASGWLNRVRKSSPLVS